jgi:tetratricopeptide (TPR) repeat protein
MEPVTTGTVAPLLLKAAMSLATGPARSLLSRKTQRVRVAFYASRKARTKGISISRRSIRKWLARPDTREQLANGTPEAVQSALDSLAWLIAGDHEGRQAKASELLFIILIEFVRLQNPSTATALSTAWVSKQVAAEGQAVRDSITWAHDSILNQLSAPQLFTDDIRLLHPWRRTSAEEIIKIWPSFAGFVHSLVTTGDRAGLLREWAKHPPEPFMVTPAEVWCWFGQVAADYGEGRAAVEFFKGGIERGAHPESYWWARAALHADSTEPEDHALSESLLLNAGEPHLLGQSIAALHRGDFKQATALLDRWAPEIPNDRALKAVLLSASFAGQQDFNRAIAVVLEAAKDEDSNGVALRAAEMLLTRAHHGLSDHSLADFAQAFALALRARNARRAWGGDSTAAVLVAVTAAALSQDVDRAWRLTQPSPAGEATPDEATDPRLRREGAVLSAMMGRLDRAQELAAEVGDPYIDATVAAHVALAAGDVEAANEAWLAASMDAPDDVAMLTTAAALAENGGQLPDLSDLEQRQPEHVAEIRAVHEAVAGGDEKLHMLRAHAPESPRLTVALADFYSAREDYAESAKALEAGATRWNHPLLMRMAAYRHQQAGDHRAAQRACESALMLGGPEWAGEFETRVILFEALEAQGLQDESIQQARRLVALDSNDNDTRWALVYCLARKGDSEAAWRALTPNGDPVPPRNTEDARMWIGLMSAYNTSPYFISRALATMKRWPDDEELLGIFIAQIYSGLHRDELNPEKADLEALHEATRNYTQRFPDSPTFRAIAVPEDDPLGGMADQLREQHEALSQLEAKVRNGEAPLGMLAEAVGRSYTEAAIRRAAGMVRSHAPQRSSQAASDIVNSLNSSVALDTTAACTLALLDPALVAELVGAFTQLESTDGAFRDALSAQQALGLRSTMSAVWDPARNRARPVVISDDAAEGLAQHSDKICSVLTSTRRRAWPRLKHFPGLEDGAWLSTLDMAVDGSLALWCDDYVLGSLAASMGIPTFGTVGLMRHLAVSGRIDPEVVQTAEAGLVRNYHVELGFDVRVMTLAAAIDRWEPLGAAFALTRPHAWQSPEQVVAFLLTALTHQLDRTPDELRQWISCAAMGLVRVAGEASDASSNLRILLGSLLAQPWLRPDRFPAVVAGVRQGLVERPHIEDPLHLVLTSQYETLVGQHGHVVASQLLMALVQHASDDDRRSAARIILTTH